MRFREQEQSRSRGSDGGENPGSSETTLFFFCCSPSALRPSWPRRGLSGLSARMGGERRRVSWWSRWQNGWMDGWMAIVARLDDYQFTPSREGQNTAGAVYCTADLQLPLLVCVHRLGSEARRQAGGLEGRSITRHRLQSDREDCRGCSEGYEFDLRFQLRIHGRSTVVSKRATTAQQGPSWLAGGSCQIGAGPVGYVDAPVGIPSWSGCEHGWAGVGGQD